MLSVVPAGSGVAAVGVAALASLIAHYTHRRVACATPANQPPVAPSHCPPVLTCHTVSARVQAPLLSTPVPFMPNRRLLVPGLARAGWCDLPKPTRKSPFSNECPWRSKYTRSGVNLTPFKQLHCHTGAINAKEASILGLAFDKPGTRHTTYASARATASATTQTRKQRRALHKEWKQNVQQNDDHHGRHNAHELVVPHLYRSSHIS